MLKRNLSLLLTIIMLLSIFTIAPITANAASTDKLADTGANTELFATGYAIPSETTFANRLAQLKEKYYPNGYSGAYYENGYAMAWQCYGYACVMLNEIFGIKYYSDGFVNMADYTMGELYAGDIVRIRGNTHSIFITRVTSKGYYITDGNWDGANGVRWDAFYTKDEMAATFTYKIHVPGSTLKGNAIAQTGLYADTPKLNNAACSAAGITVSWDEVEEASGYRVFYKGGSQKVWKTIGSTPDTSFLYAAELEYGTEYTFTVRVLDCYDEVISKYDKDGITAKYIVAPPELKSVKAGVDKTTITWSAVKGVSYYRVYAKGNKDTSWHTIGIVKGTSFNHTSGEAHTTYQYTVRCLNNSKKLISGCSPKPLSAAYITYATQLDAPSNIVAAYTTKQGVMKLSWDAVTGAKRYMVFYYRYGIDKSWKRLGATTKTYCYPKDCVNATKYRFTVRCVDEKNKYMSDYLSGPTIYYYNIPEKLKAVKKDDDGNIKVSWGAVKGASSYAFYYKTPEMSKWKRVTTEAPITGTSYVFGNCEDGVKYTFTVRACNQNGKIVSSYDPIGVSLTYTVTPQPTEAPTEAPTETPTETPTDAPTETPTDAPTEAPTQVPTEEPTQAPTEAPTE